MAEVGGSWFSQVWCCWVLLVVGDRQCLGLMLLGFWVAQIGDGFGGDWRGHGEVMVRSCVVEMGVDSDGHRHLAISPLIDLSF